MTRALALCGFLLVLTAITGARSAQTPTVRTTSTGVVIDVSVLNSTGQPVLDLRPDEFEVSEDGTPQQILSVRLVHAGTARVQESQASAKPGVANANPAPGGHSIAAAARLDSGDNTSSVTAILFDLLSPEARPLAQRAALAYVGTLTPPRDYAGVFVADVALKTFAPFTNDGERLRRAVGRLAATAPANLSAGAERATTTRVQGFDPRQAPTAGAESAGAFVSTAKVTALMDPSNDTNSEMLLLRLQLRMEEGFQRFASEYEGQTSIVGLKSVVDALSALPGRKSILYFTENLQVPSRMKPRFDALIGEANRASITVYPVDAAGLRVQSKEAEAGRAVAVAGAQGVGDLKRGTGPWTKDLENQEQIVSSRPVAVLGRLAKDTGGFVIENTNALAAGVARMQQERTTYYLIGYQPTNGVMDGRFRKISVKVTRPKVTVKARPGYAATPPSQR
jgi:VWFA-related protein